MARILCIVILTGWAGIHAAAQTATPADTAQVISPFTFGVYADVYYLYDFNRPADRERPPFVYQYGRHNEIALNNAILSAAYATDRVRGNFALHTGTYVQRNYAAEALNGSEVLKFIYQANAGLRLAKGLWLDAGIMPSHIGFESAVSLDNPTLTRSLMADNTPYYEAGAKLTWEAGDKLTVAALVLNGWQRIVETDNNKAFGTQIQYRPAEGVLLNSSTFFGREGGYRYFHNFYAVFDFADAVTLITAFDVGRQAQPGRNGGPRRYQTWWNPNVIVRYHPAGHWAVAARAEYFHDPGNVIIAPTQLGTALATGFQTFSPSLNVDYAPVENVALRVEGRLYRSKSRVFIRDNALAPDNALVAASLAFRF